MADLIGRLISTMSMVIITKPISLGFSLLAFCIKAGFLVINTWAELIAGSINLHLRLFRSCIVCLIALVSIPHRVLTALQKERMLEEQLVLMQTELEDVKWERNVLEGHLRAALGSVRDEHHQLKLTQGEQQAKLKSESLSSSANRSTSHCSNMDEVLEQRDVAFWQSVLSAMLSLTVGMIIYEAKDANCMPLVVALYTVVGMSMKNVVKFFSTIDNKPASDAVALLSFNCFILGTLTYPTLPKVVRILGSLVST
ncbi:hypothetical protein LINPERHAP1_LOCUS24102 [Linum perenne]